MRLRQRVVFLLIAGCLPLELIDLAAGTSLFPIESAGVEKEAIVLTVKG
jgi:hypothetical protein